MQLEELVVTANKREQRLDKVDGAVSAVTAARLADNDVRNVSDLQKVLPGVVIESRGNRAYANFTIRGISSADFYNPAVQVYVDGVPQASANLAQDLFDVSRVELLRGPQGTLYGMNAFAGVLNITTEKPRFNRVDVFATAADRLFEIGTATTSVLVPDTLFLDLGFKERYFTGQIRDINRNRDDIDWSNGLSGRAALRYAPAGGDFDANLFASHDSLRSREETYILDSDVKARAFRSSVIPFPYSFLGREATTAGLTMNYRLSDVTFSSVTSFQGVELDRRIFGQSFPETYQSLYQEFRAAYDAGGPFKGVAGIAFFDNEFTRRASGTRNAVDASSVAMFGEGTYALTDLLDLTVGARVAYDWSSIRFNGGGFGFNFNNDADFTNFQPKISLGYQVDPTTRIYALVSEGYKPGGFNRTVASPLDAVAYKPERAWNYEVGARTDMLNGMATVSGAFYRIESSNQQIFAGPVGFQVLRNAAEGTSTGVEVELTLRPTDRLTLTAQGSLGRSEFSDYTDPVTGQRIAGGRTPYAPDLVTNVGFRYRIDQTWIPAQMALTGAARTVSRTYFDPNNVFSQGSFTTFDTGLDFAFGDASTLRVFANNLTDRTYRTYSFAFGPATLSTIGQPRIVGVSWRTRF
ncbi:TonB-dependent receptor [Methylobacterium sp. E-045]|uniref:TonB-dependent receptor n=1 Tax=Methylobacterium sp. E-045 TaxID=2836575 RepID=UPI001FB8E6B9|nr:TonB-dependent receptor [Methylobacterium sp. E-045]